MKKQIIFSKDGRLRFVGHLDMMRTMQRAMTRAGIKLSYSQGFNPHPNMSFASPLALGASGENEIMEIRIENEMSDREIFENLSRELPNGLHVKAVRTIPDTQSAIMSLVKVNEYRIVFPKDLPMKAILDQLLSQDAIMLKKLGKVKGRKQLIDVDVKPLIHQVVWEDDHTLLLQCEGGSETNLKPELLLTKMYQEAGCEERQHEETICRTRMFGRSEEGLVDYSDYRLWECHE